MNKKSAVAPATQQEFATPSLLRRFAAMVYDSLLLMAISILYGAMATGINVLINGAPVTGERVNWGGFGVIVFIGWLVTIVFFFCYFWHKSGQTLGMKTWGIRMHSTESLDLPDYKQCIIRCCLAPISFFLLGIGYWAMYLNAERQTLHDKLSNTRILLLAKDVKK